MGLLDGFLPDDPQKKEAARMALLAASMGMLTGRGRNFGEVAGQAGLLGLNAYGNYLNEATRAADRKRELDMRAQQEARQAQFQALQMKQMQRGMDQEDAAIAGMREDFANQQPQAPAVAGGQFPLMGGQQAPQGPRVDPRQLPSIANSGASGVETFPVPGPFDPPPQAAEGSGEMERLLREAAMGGDRYAPPPSPEQQMMAQQRQQAERDMATAVRMNDTKGYAEAKKRRDAMLVIDPSKRYVLPGGGVIEPPQKPEALSALDKLINARDRLPADHPNRALYDKAIEKETGRPLPADWDLFKQENPNGTYAQYMAEKERMRRAGATQVNVGKETPPQVVKELAEISGERDHLTRLVTEFKPDFAGDVSETLGRAKNEIGMRFGDESGRAQWWQDYQSYTNRVRNRLFGSALTPTEKREFDRAMVHPGMSPEEIRKNLSRQQKAVNDAANKLGGVYGAGTYNKEQIERATAPTVEPSNSGWKIERVQ